MGKWDVQHLFPDAVTGFSTRSSLRGGAGKRTDLIARWVFVWVGFMTSKSRFVDVYMASSRDGMGCDRRLARTSVAWDELL